MFHIVSPIYQKIDGDSLKSAIKNFVKINDMNRLTQLIVSDQQNNTYYNASINYYNSNNARKARISISNTDNVGWNVYPFLNQNKEVNKEKEENKDENKEKEKERSGPIVFSPGYISTNDKGMVLPLPIYSPYSSYVPTYPKNPSINTLPIIAGSNMIMPYPF